MVFYTFFIHAGIGSRYSKFGWLFCNPAPPKIYEKACCGFFFIIVLIGVWLIVKFTNLHFGTFYGSVIAQSIVFEFLIILESYQTE